MKLTGKLKTQVESAPTKEEKREAVRKAGMLLSDEELEQISGGRDLVFPEGYCHLHGRFRGSQCPLCNSQ